ncbi:sulfotransferase family protein [Pseudomonas sp. R-28-1W-6]|uniref:sulfotransferase family protein n=1 Tax=Pseudomonas sp. R-28-1W-6 TaxID=2650101 RepID=UPI0021148499|nr:sulfotransferase family protein [Pseudomonas sp. R-28-1W-6]
MESLMAAGQAFDGWLPIGIAAQNQVVDWCWFGEQRLHQPFYRDDVERALHLPFNQAFRRATPLQALLDWQHSSPGLAPRAFIYHASRCGSTLLAQMLASLPSQVLLSEPAPLDSLLRARAASLPEAAKRSALAALLSAFGQRRSGLERSLVVKLDAWNIFELPLLQRCFPATPWLFLYRDPLEIAVSHLRQPGMHMVPGLLGHSPLDSPEDAGLSREGVIARRLGRLLAQGLQHCQALGGLAVNYTELPAALGNRLQPVFGLSDSELRSALSMTRQHAKQPHLPFSADSQAKRLSASVALRDELASWADQPYRQLEQLRQTQIRQAGAALQRQPG